MVGLDDLKGLFQQKQFYDSKLCRQVINLRNNKRKSLVLPFIVLVVWEMLGLSNVMHMPALWYSCLTKQEKRGEKTVREKIIKHFFSTLGALSRTN